MRRLLFPLSFLSPFALFAATLMLAIGVKGDPMDLKLAAWGVALMALAALAFPRPGHPMFEFLNRLHARIEKKQGVAKDQRADTTNTSDATQDTTDAVGLLREIVDFNKEVAEFEAVDKPYHAGWTRLDLHVGADTGATSWIGGLPELPDDIAWPESNGFAAMFLAQIALSDLPNNIWGGLGPKSGWLVFFVAPLDCGGVTVLHIEKKGAARPYPNGAVIENYASSDVRAATRASGRPISGFRPRKWALKASRTQEHPPGPLDRLDVNNALWDDYRDIDLTDPRLSTFANNGDVSHFSVNMQALDAYASDPSAFSPDVRALFERRWAAETESQSATMSGPVSSEFWYTAPKEPVALLRIPSSQLVGWDFHDAAPLGVFISPRDLKRGRWHKAWFDIAN